MSEATKEKVSVQEAGETNEVSGDERFSLSAEEADRVASLFRPSWEGGGEDDGSRASAPDDDDAPAYVPFAEPEAQPPSQAATADVEQVHPAAEAAEQRADAAHPAAVVQPDPPEEPAADEPEPIVVVGESPNLAEVEPKDESSSVIPDDPPESTPAPQPAHAQPAPAQPKAAPAPQPAPVRPAPQPAAVNAIVECDMDISPLPDRRGRNLKVAIAVLAVASLLVVVGGVRELLSADEQEDANMPAVTATAPPEPAERAEPPAEETSKVEPAAPPTEATTEPTAKSRPEKTPESPPESTLRTRPAAPPRPISRAPRPPRKSDRKPPKTSNPPTKPPPKSTGGGIVRETPF